MNKFLWFLATSDPQILGDVSDKTERFRHSIIGTLVLITGIFAVITASFTASLLINDGQGLDFSTNNWILPLCIGAVWGLLIITVDRLLISSISTERRNRHSVLKKVEQDSDQGSENLKTKISFSQTLVKSFKSFCFLVLRLGIAFMISLCISKPFELLLFQDQIEKQAVLIKLDETQKAKELLIQNSNLSDLDEEIQDQEGELELLNKKLEKAEKIDQYRRLRNRRKATISANNREISRIRRFSIEKYLQRDTANTPIKALNQQGKERIKFLQGRNAKAKSDTLTQRRSLLAQGIKERELRDLTGDAVQEEILSMSNTVKQTEQQRMSEQESVEEEAARNKEKIDNSLDDLFGKLDSLNEYIQDPAHPQRKYTSWLILFIFLAIESLPILSKMLTSSGEYEERARSRHEETLRNIAQEESRKVQTQQTYESRISKLEQNLQKLLAEEISLQKIMDEYDQQVPLHTAEETLQTNTKRKTENPGQVESPYLPKV